MCSPGTTKSNEELASKLRLHIVGLQISTKELTDRGFSVVYSTDVGYRTGAPTKVEIKKTLKTEVIL